MPKFIAILEDNAERRAVMQACIADRFYTFEARFFDEPTPMIEFLEANLADVLVISLDNDLDMKPGADGRLVDVGEGRQVAEYLATCEPCCPVVIHSSNTAAAESMKLTLRDNGWKTKRVVPMDDTKWIEDDWFFAMRRILVGSATGTRLESLT